MIRSLSDYSKEDLVEMTQASTDHNTDMIWSGEFQQRARAHNEVVRDQILKEFK
jgi:hypothetical protein